MKCGIQSACWRIQTWLIHEGFVTSSWIVHLLHKPLHQSYLHHQSGSSRIWVMTHHGHKLTQKWVNCQNLCQEMPWDKEETNVRCTVNQDVNDANKMPKNCWNIPGKQWEHEAQKPGELWHKSHGTGASRRPKLWHASQQIPGQNWKSTGSSKHQTSSRKSSKFSEKHLEPSQQYDKHCGSEEFSCTSNVLSTQQCHHKLSFPLLNFWKVWKKFIKKDTKHWWNNDILD